MTRPKAESSKIMSMSISFGSIFRFWAVCSVLLQLLPALAHPVALNPSANLPSDPDSLYALAQKKLYHDNKGAEMVMRKAINLRPNNGDYWNMLGYAMSQYKDKNPCIPILQKAARLAPTSSAPWQNLGWVYQEQHKFDAAVGAYKKATLLAPDTADPWYCLGNVYLAKHEYALSDAVKNRQEVANVRVAR